jgi:dynein regulatory complex subunit 2
MSESTQISTRWLGILRKHKFAALKEEAASFKHDLRREIGKKDSVLDHLFQKLENLDDLNITLTQEFDFANEQLTGITREMLDDFKIQFEKEEELAEKQHKFELEQLQILHDQELREVKTLIKLTREEFDVGLAGKKSEFDQYLDFLKNTNIEKYHQTRNFLEEKIEQLKDKANQQLSAYKQSTEQLSNDYKLYMEKDLELTKQVEDKQKDIEKVQTEISTLKLKYKNIKQEFTIKNFQLKKERDRMVKNLNEIKVKEMNRHNLEHSRYLNLTRHANKCRDKLKFLVSQGQKILHLNEICQSKETEYEKYQPFYSNALISHVETFEDLKFADDLEKQQAMTAYEEMQLKILPDEYHYLDGFFRRYNKAVLDVVQLKMKLRQVQVETDKKQQKVRDIISASNLSDDSKLPIIVTKLGGS